MQTTYHIKAGDINAGLLESIKKLFRESDAITLTVRSEAETALDQHDLFLKSEALQKKYPPIRVNADIDLSNLADEVNL